MFDSIFSWFVSVDIYIMKNHKEKLQCFVQKLDKVIQRDVHKVKREIE